MERPHLRPALLAGVLILLAGLGSCGDMGDGITVLWGNYHFQRGEYQKAAIEYLSVLERGKNSPFLQYNLGNVYNALGESNSALALWNAVDPAAPEPLLFRLYFNQGHLEFQKGLYQKAFESFRRALVISPHSRDAKRNLELSLQKAQAQGPAVSAKADPASTAAGATQESRTMLEYIQRLEGNQWKSNRTPEPTAPGDDW